MLRRDALIAVRLVILFVGLLCSWTFSASLSAQQLEPSRPNIILMMADDMGWGSIDAPGYSVRLGLNPDDSEVRYQGTPNWETPNLAAMASSGLSFSRMYSQSPVCSPTRASVLTGRHPERLGIPFANRGKMENREITLTEYAKTLGYKTGMFGKWHLGTMTRDVNDSNRGGPGSFGIYSFPTNNGFDELYATESKTNTFDPVAISPTTHYWTDPGVFVPFNSPELLGDDSAIISRETNAFMEQAVNDEQPFLSVVWFHTPHKPVTGPGLATNSFAAYVLAMEDLDAAVGEIRAKVQQLGIADNTVIMFTSDNGPEDDQDWNADVVPLRANKRELFEGGLRVPGLIEWAGTVAPGETHTPMVTSDYLPTILDIWGIEPADARPLDGQSMVNTIFNDRNAPRERTMVFQSTNNHQSAVGIGGRYKLISIDGGSSWTLYDIVYDFDENDPVATSADIGSQPQNVQDIYNTLLTDFNERATSIGSGVATSYAVDYQTQVSSATGIALQDEPPENLEEDRRNGNLPELFIERQYATLTSALTADSDGTDGTYDTTDAAIVSAGTVVHSYLVHHDPESVNTADFEITFDDEIVGVIGSPQQLTASDWLSFADPNFEASRGLNEGQDSWTISNDGHTISFSSVVNAQSDMPIDSVSVQESTTVMADGTAVPVDGNGDIDSSVFAAPAGPRDPTTGLAWKYGIRERSNGAQVDRRAYSFLRFDVSNLTADVNDPAFNAVFSVDYQGHLNNTNVGLDVELGQVTSSWNTTSSPAATLSTNSTSLGTLVSEVETEGSQKTVTLDITALVKGWADGSIANHGLTFTSNANVDQAGYFTNAEINTSLGGSPAAGEGMDQVRILTTSSMQFVPVQDLCQLGDVNCDGSVTFLDISPFIALLSSGEYQYEADTNQDNAVTFLDIAPFIAILAGTP